MIGTTRPRVCFFMNRFRKLGLIDYNGSIEIHSSLLNVVLRDQPQIRRDNPNLTIGDASCTLRSPSIYPTVFGLNYLISIAEFAADRDRCKVPTA